MEKEISIGNVNFQPTKTGKDKWVIATNDGNLSVWDGEMAEQLNKITGQSVKVDIRPAAPDTNYLPTITKVDFDSAVPSGQVLKEVQNGVRSLNGQEQKPIRVDGTYCGNYNKDKSIIAQCLVKAACGTNEITIKQAVEMYKEALELLG